MPACALATLRSIARLATVVKRLLKRSAGAARAMVIGSLSNSSVWPKSCVGGPPRPPKTPSYSLPRSQRPLVLHYEQRNPPFWLLEGSRGVNGQQDQGLTSWATTFAPSAALLGTHSSLVTKIFHGPVYFGWQTSTLSLVPRSRKSCRIMTQMQPLMPCGASHAQTAAEIKLRGCPRALGIGGTAIR